MTAADAGGDQVAGIAGRSFGSAFRGFDKAEVRAFLADVAEQQRGLEHRAAAAESRLEELRARLESVEQLLKSADEKYVVAQAHLEEIEAERREAAAQPLPGPELDAVKVFGERVTEVLQVAVAAGDSIRAEAEAWASHRRQEAIEHAETTIAFARQEVAEIVAREEMTVDQLRSTEEALRSWLQAAHSAIGQVLAQPAVGPGELAAVVGKIRELGPSSSEPSEPEPSTDSDEVGLLIS
jgi:DivIVA domain-containing protein